MIRRYLAIAAVTGVQYGVRELRHGPGSGEPGGEDLEASAHSEAVLCSFGCASCETCRKIAESLSKSRLGAATFGDDCRLDCFICRHALRQCVPILQKSGGCRLEAFGNEIRLQKLAALAHVGYSQAFGLLAGDS